MTRIPIVVGSTGFFEGVPPGLSPWKRGWAESTRQSTEATIAEIVNPLEAQETEDFVETLRGRLRAKGFSRVAELIRIESDMPHRELLKTRLSHSDALSPIIGATGRLSRVRQRVMAASGIDSTTKVICALWIQNFAENALGFHEDFLDSVYHQGVTRAEAHEKLLKGIDYLIDMYCTRDDSTLIQAELSPFLLSTEEQAGLPTRADVILRYYPDRQDSAERMRKRATKTLKLLY